MAWRFWQKKPLEPREEKAGNLLQIEDLSERYGTLVKAGVKVNPTVALQLTSVLACVRVISEGIAQIPLKVMRHRGRTRSPADDMRIFRLLHRQPNDWMTSFEFREALTMQALLTGNAYAYIVRYGGEIRELIPLMANQVRVEQRDNYKLVYTVNDGKEIIGEIGSKNILHLRGPTINAVTGLEIVKLARDAIGLAVATEEYQANLHANGAKPAGVLSTTAQLSPEAMQRVREQWQRLYGSSQNAFKTVVLDGAWDFKQMGQSSVDAQTMEARRFQIEEICRAFRVFPQMVMQADKAATYASAEQFFLAHVVHSLGPWIDRWEQTIDRDLLDNDELYAHFEVNGLLRGASKDRAQYYQTLYNIGALSPNEIRAYEDLNPYDGGDEFRVPMNMEAPGDEHGDETP